MFGNPETTTGGKALKFYASIRIDVRRAEQIKSGTDVVGNHVKIKIVKNKMAPPFKSVEVDIIYGKGISAVSSIFELALQYGIITKAGSWFSYNEERIAQGREKVLQLLESNTALCEEITEKIKNIAISKPLSDDLGDDESSTKSE